MSKNLKQAFKEACDLFNDGRYNDLLPRMDIDIILKRVDDPGSVVGIGNVIAYLNGHQEDQQPQFDLVKTETVRGEDETNGQISGTAHYQDNKHEDTKILVRFTFTFIRNDTDSDWMLINAFAAPTE